MSDFRCAREQGVSHKDYRQRCERQCASCRTWDGQGRIPSRPDATVSAMVPIKLFNEIRKLLNEAVAAAKAMRIPHEPW